MKKVLILAGLVGLSLVLLACNGAQQQVVTGVVLTVHQPSAGQVDGFTLRTPDGQVMTFTVGVVDQDEGAFPPQHLTEHQRTADPVKVTYKVQNGGNVATKLQDADESVASEEPSAATAASGVPSAATAASGVPSAATAVPTGATSPAH